MMSICCVIRQYLSFGDLSFVSFERLLKRVKAWLSQARSPLNGNKYKTSSDNVPFIDSQRRALY